MFKKFSLLMAIIVLINLITYANAAPSGEVILGPGIDPDNFLTVNEEEVVTIVFTNTATGLTDVASIIQYPTISAAIRNPSRISIIGDASVEIYDDTNTLRIGPITVTTVKETSSFIPPGPSAPAETVDLYTWSLGPPNGTLSALTDYALQWNDGLRVIRPQESLNLTITVRCEGEGDSVSWFFFRATEAAYASGSYPTDIATIPSDERVNLYYSKLPGPPTNPTYWLPLHNSYDPYDDDISSGHAFEQNSWDRISTNTRYAKINKIHHQSPNGNGAGQPGTYGLHLCGLKFYDVDLDGTYNGVTEGTVNGVKIFLLGADGSTPAENYYSGSFDYASDTENPITTGTKGLAGAYCFNLDNVTTNGGIAGSATYVFYIKVDESESKLTTSSIIGPISLIAGDDVEQRNSIHNNFGNRLIDPVGGVFAPVNKLTVLTPYIALAGFIGVLSSVLFMIKKRRA